MTLPVGSSCVCIALYGHVWTDDHCPTVELWAFTGRQVRIPPITIDRRQKTTTLTHGSKVGRRRDIVLLEPKLEAACFADTFYHLILSQFCSRIVEEVSHVGLWLWEFPMRFLDACSVSLGSHRARDYRYALSVANCGWKLFLLEGHVKNFRRQTC
jgi:hypothetical protein